MIIKLIPQVLIRNTSTTSTSTDTNNNTNTTKRNQREQQHQTNISILELLEEGVKTAVDDSCVSDGHRGAEPNVLHTVQCVVFVTSGCQIIIGKH